MHRKEHLQLSLLCSFVYSIVFAPTLTKRVIENNVTNTAITYHVKE